MKTVALAAPVTGAPSFRKETMRRVMTALAVFALMWLGITSWQAAEEELGDPLIAALLVFVAGLPFAKPVAGLLMDRRRAG